jgi:hypothetical protein
MTQEKCRSCGADIVWCQTGKGKAMPVDAEPCADGNVAITASQVPGQLPFANVLTPPTLGLEALHKSHFATCPDADRWRVR